MRSNQAVEVECASVDRCVSCNRRVATPFEVAEDIASAWGSLFIDAGEAGHLNAESGHGPWPEGSMTFAQFMTRL